MRARIAQRRRDVVVLGLEDVVQEERCALVGSEPFQHR
jgi:hypothetical protein